jgi:autotransporter-associated beta strand protein
MLSVSPFGWTDIGPTPINAQASPPEQFAGRVTGIAVDNVTGAEYLTAAGGGVWKSQDNGNTWAPLTFGQQTLVMSAIALAPNGGQPEIIYAASGDIDGNAGFRNYSTYGVGILKSTDGGGTWTLLTGQTPGNPNANVFNRRTISKIVVDPSNPNTIYAAVYGGGFNGAAGNTGIWKSTDAGVTWVNTTAGIDSVDGWTDVAIDPANPQILYAALGNSGGSAAKGVYVTTTGGTGSIPWTLVSALPSGFTPDAAGNAIDRISLAIGTSDPERVYVLMADTTSNLYGMWTRQDNGTWTDLTNNPGLSLISAEPQLGYDNVLALDPLNAQIVYAFGSINAVASQDGGNTWQRINYDGPANSGNPSFLARPHDDYHAAVFCGGRVGTNSQPLQLLVGNDGGIWRLENPETDFGPYSNPANQQMPQWTCVNGNLGITQFYHVALGTSPTSAFGAAQDNGISQYLGSPSWTSTAGGDGFDVAVSPNQGLSMVYTSRAGVANGAVEHNYSGNPAPLLAGGGYFVVDPTLYGSGQDRLLYAGGGTEMAESTDSDTTWHSITGAGWPVDGSGNSLVTVINFDLSAAHPDTIYAVVHNNSSGAYGTLVTVDDGQHWVLLDPPPDASVLQTSFDNQSDFHVDPANDHLAYAVDYAGRVYRGQLTTDASGLPTNLTWQDITGTGLPTSPVDAGPASLYAIAAYPLGPQDRVLYVGTDIGVYSSSNDGTTWHRVGNPAGWGGGLPNARVADLEMQNYQDFGVTGGTFVAGNILAAGTYGIGMWETEFGVTASVVNGNLEIYGDANDDVITVELDPNTPALDVWEGGPHNPFDQLVGSFALAGLTGVTVTVQNTDNTINIEDSVAGVPVTVNLGTGQSTVNISPFSQTLDTIQANVTINPGGGDVTLNVDDQKAKLFLAQYALTSSSVGRGPGTIFYSGVNNLNLNGNVSAVYYVFSTEAFGNGATTTINTGAGFATVNVQNNDNVNSTLNIVSIGGGGNNVVNLGDNGSVQGILGPVNIENPPSFDHINIDDSADPTALTWFLSTLGTNPDDSQGNGDLWGQVSYSLTNLLINYEYADTSSLTLDTGTGVGSNALVLATNPKNLACQTNIVSRAPTNVYVGDRSRQVDAQGIASTLNLETPPSGDTIFVDDSVDTQARTATLSTLGSNPADSEQNNDEWGQISGLAQGNINYEVGDVGTLTLDGSGAGTTFDVAAVPNISLVLEGVGGTNKLNGPNQANAWTLNGKNAGVLDGLITFRPAAQGDGFQDLAGGNVGDTFTLSSLGPVAMNLVLNSPGQLTNPSGTQSLTGTVNNNGHLLTAAGAGSTTLQGVVSGPGGLSMQGTGTLTLAASNSYGGGTTVGSGTLVATKNGALGAANTTTGVDAGAILALSGGINYSTVENVTLNGPAVGKALLNLSGANTFKGTITLEAPSQISSSAGTLTLTGAVQEGPNGLTVSGPGNVTFKGVISGSGGLDVQGGGRVTLAASNTYTGPTTTNGTLVVSGTQASSTITVNAGGLLAGTGSVKALVVNGGGTVAPGTLNGAVGVLTATSANFSGGGTLLIHIPAYGTPGVNYDQLSVTGTLTLGGASKLTLDLKGLPGPGTAPGIVLYASHVGTFTTKKLINNPHNLGLALTYGLTSLDADFS